MKPILTVFCWAGDDERIERHWPYWERTGCDILLSFPINAPCKRGGLAFGKSEHHGPEIMGRIFKTFRHVLQFNRDCYWFTEADSITLKKAPQHIEGGLHGFLWQNPDLRFKASQYPHYPHGMNHNTLAKLAIVSAKYDLSAEEGFQDRLIGRICEETGIPMIHRADLAYSRNLLDTDEYFFQAQEAIDKGITFLHGIKTKQQLDRLKIP